MSEAPIALNKSSINIYYKEKNYEINLSQKSNNLFISAKDMNSNPTLKYEQEFSKCSLNQISKFFKIFDDISELLPELKKRIESKNTKIEVDNQNLNIILNVDILNVNEICLQLRKKENDIKVTDENLNKVINELNNKIKELENEVKNLKEKLLPLNTEKEETLEIFQDSKILKTSEDKKMVSNWIKPNEKIKFNLLYQVSRDGDRTSTFYEKVKGKAPTLCLVKTKAGFKCGGYTTNLWNQTGYRKDELAFLFSLDKKKKYTIKSGQVDNGVYACNSYFAFGGGHDLKICDNCTKGNENYCNTPYSFNTTEKSELTGQYNFIVDECEIYHVEFV